MSSNRPRLPLRKTSSGEHIDTRPLYIEEWLDSLPYIDFQKTGQLLCEATQYTNQQAVKFSTRLELVRLYNRPYQYFIDSRIKTGTQHTLQSIETLQSQVKILKRMAVNLGHACKLAADQELQKKTLFRKQKPPLEALLLSFHYLSHALIFSYIEYSPTPKNVWRELNSIYDFAESLGKENFVMPLPTTDNRNSSTTSIAQAYKCIVLASLSDPHHLPFGAIWEIYEQLYSWTDHIQLTGFKSVDKTSGCFVVNLDSDASPLPYFKFDVDRTSDKHRLVNATGLARLVEEKYDSISKGESLKDILKLSPNHAKFILCHLSKVWGSPPKRNSARTGVSGTLFLACGINAVYFFVNNQSEFVAEPDKPGNNVIVEGPGDIETGMETTSANYMAEQWELSDQGQGGVALVRSDRPKYDIRVGDLIVFSDKAGGGKWSTGIIRWMMVRLSSQYKIGIQILSESPVPVAVRARHGSALDCQFRRAILLEDGSRTTIITGKGMFIENRALEIKSEKGNSGVKASAMKESTLGFEWFNVEPQADSD